ncbi:MAG: hypothetical protein ACP5TO_07880, partial [Thermoplasmata archaeon]
MKKKKRDVNKEEYGTKMRDFTRHFEEGEYVFIIGKIRKLVNESPPPYKTREEGTRGRHPSNPRYVITAIINQSFIFTIIQ